ncbi:SDR family NAD(P)-dependent oxidoreductase [Paraburkholderia sp. FT54]|uniref:SDR family NAD(P)-dependent oxidoreductase n=1 Tax=Paraburkholderia sp. FT54 TaxID=3074437 RepID=UPI0028780B3D|nr:SDR family NAD(P)-dependent oxidoreductase [Paraburkholderia sp. FT54]WNC94982.1 SDR family NAD(P)-dependent oxidoreductase [Paraburkholderia sp. FT54]
MNAYDFSQRSAVVTGGAQGIGYAIAERLLDAGARVVLWDCDEIALAAAKISLSQYGEVEIVKVDITRRDEVQQATDIAIATFGRIDALVHSAGIAGANAPVVDYPADEWARVIDIDLNATFHVNQAVVRTMIDQGYGRIVNIASIAGKEGNPTASAYSAAKAGVIALTKSLGKETAKLDIAVNCVTPAAARTKIFDQMSQQHIDYMLSKIPRGRFVEVKEIAAMVMWLVSSENSFTTGAVFDLSGGRATY